MKVYKRNPLLKVICGIFILAHAIIGGRMVSTNNTIMGSIVIAVSLFWIFSLINECTPYIRMDGKSLQVYSNFLARPREFIFNKEFQMYYHTNERLVFTYLTPRGIREKARVQLGYMDPGVSANFVQEFRQIIEGFHPVVREEQVVLAETAAVSATEKASDQSEKEKKPVKKTKTSKVESTKAETKVQPRKKAKAEEVAKKTSTKTTKVSTTKVSTTTKTAKKKKESKS